MASPKTILLLDADEQSAQDIQRFLKVSAYTFNVSHASDIPEGLNYLKTRKPDIVLVDGDLTLQSDFGTVRVLLEKNKIPAILLSDVGGEEIKQMAQNAGAGDYLVKNKVNLFNLQKIIVNILKLSETETKLDHVFVEHLNQQESFIQLLNKMSEGVLVLNRDNVIKYANTKAYNMLGDDSFKARVLEHITYRDVEDEELIEFKSGKKYNTSLRISDLLWNGERTNLFIITQSETSLVKTPGSSALEMLTDLLRNIDANILLLKGDMIAFVTKTVAKTLLMTGEEVRRKKLYSILEAREDGQNVSSVKSFVTEQLIKGALKPADGTVIEINYQIKQLNLDNELYQLLSYEIIPIPEGQGIPKARSDEEQFSTEGVLHLASHDLREPVRTILNYVQLISDNIRSRKYDQAAEYADFARTEASRMERLLSDLKVYIGLNGHTFSMSKVSMKMAASDVVKAMKPMIERLGAEVTIAQLPDVSADRELVEELLMHLIDNAIKFQRKDKKPVIDIGFDKFEGNVIFCVKDNGIGISKKYHSKIFDLFERLNRVDEYPGNGLGLAICKKVVEMHGGKIWIESLPGMGTGFYFTLRSN